MVIRTGVLKENMIVYKAVLVDATGAEYPYGLWYEHFNRYGCLGGWKEGNPLFALQGKVTAAVVNLHADNTSYSSGFHCFDTESAATVFAARMDWRNTTALSYIIPAGTKILIGTQRGTYDNIIVTPVLVNPRSKEDATSAGA
jgi:hypothetical protein